MARRRPGVLLELHSADRLVRELVYAELQRRGLRPNLFPKPSRLTGADEQERSDVQYDAAERE
jgi:hypothetical protein